MHRDRKIERTLEGWAVQPGSGTAVWVAAAFEDWESLYSFFETMFEGRREDVALNMLHNGTTKRNVISEDGGIIHLSTLAGAPGALPAKVEGRIGSLYETIAESAVPELAQPVATYFSLSGKYTGYTPDETHLAAAVGFMLTHGTGAARTIFAKHAITDPSLILLSHEALRLGVPAEYIRDSSLQPSITARYGKGGYDALGLRILHERGVPAAYASALSTCRLGMLFDDPDAIASMHAAGIDAAYIMAVDEHVRKGLSDPQRFTLKSVMRAYHEGIPLEYLLA